MRRAVARAWAAAQSMVPLAGGRLRVRTTEVLLGQACGRAAEGVSGCVLEAYQRREKAAGH